MIDDEAVNVLTSYADGDARVMRAKGFSLVQLTEFALDNGIEKCRGCDWWAETGEMIPTDADEPDGKCGNCRLKGFE